MGYEKDDDGEFCPHGLGSEIFRWTMRSVDLELSS
jgi:hypothetical protein